MKTCENCGGEGGFEIPYAGRNPPWGDGADDGEWRTCRDCGGSGWEEGELPQLTLDELPDIPSELLEAE